MGIIVQKFGGTSVADVEKIKNVAKAVIREKNNGNQVIVVVSAMGHTTDYLVKMANEIVMARIEIDENSGFCFGVVKAISTAEKSLAELGKVYSLGDIVHNRIEVQRLERLGLQTISHAQFPSLEGQTVLIRAHGEPPSTYRLAKEHGIRLIDATCPVVSHLHGLVKKAHEQMARCNGQVVILGKRGHAEVVGLTGEVDEDAIVVETLEDLEHVDFTRPI